MFDSIRKVDTDVLLQYIIPLKVKTKMSMSISKDLQKWIKS